jgi:hypothetical protein
LYEDSYGTDEAFQSKALRQASHIFTSLPLADNLIAADNPPKLLPITAIFFLIYITLNQYLSVMFNWFIVGYWNEASLYTGALKVLNALLETP